MRGNAAPGSRSRSGIDPVEPDVQVQKWLTDQLAVAPPLTSEQLCRLQLLLATDRIPARKSA